MSIKQFLKLFIPAISILWIITVFMPWFNVPRLWAWNGFEMIEFFKFAGSGTEKLVALIWVIVFWVSILSLVLSIVRSIVEKKSKVYVSVAMILLWLWVLIPFIMIIKEADSEEMAYGLWVAFVGVLLLLLSNISILFVKDKSE